MSAMLVREKTDLKMKGITSTDFAFKQNKVCRKDNKLKNKGVTSLYLVLQKR